MENPPKAEIEELYSSWALLILTVLLIGAMWTSYYLQVRKITAIHETVISIMTGTALLRPHASNAWLACKKKKQAWLCFLRSIQIPPFVNPLTKTDFALS